MTHHQTIEQTVAMLEAQRLTLGDMVVDTSLAALRKHLADLDQPEVTPLALRGERKQVTVMFADISGFTAMSEKLDPEEVRSLINACFERLGAVINRYEGHIDKFIGDEIMALFGAPVAHENDPERALRAALDMMAALNEFNAEHAEYIPQPLALHFGINSGLVIAGGIGTSQRQDYSVVGDPVNLASRLEGLSEAGEILVGEDTYRLTAPLFEFEALAPVKVKGKAKPVQVYQLRRAKKVTPGQIRGIDGFSSPLVGRQAEMAILKEALTNLQQEQGGLISVLGEAGLGKTRLITELCLICKQQSPPVRVTWAEGRALSYGENASYLVTRDLLGNLLGVEPEASPVAVGQMLRSECDRLFSGQAADIYPYLAHLLEVPLEIEAAQRVKYLEGEALHQRILQSVQKYLSARARQHPLILVWEDLHWADPSSLALLEALLPLTQECPLLLLLVYRPRRERRIWAFHNRAGQLMGRVHRCIELAPLSYEESRQLLHNLLGACNLPEKTCNLILNKAEGNPFYVEEVLRSLIDSQIVVRSDDDQRWVVTSAVEDIQIPDTLQGVIMARIDRLGLETKHILQVASVIGRNFSQQVLVSILSDEAGREANLTAQLRSLETLDLIIPTKSEGGLEYAFKHIFTQESVYSSLLRANRRQLHQQVGQALEAVFANELDDKALLLAHHFEKSQDKERALKYLKIAADRARAAYANHEANALYERALALLDEQDYAGRLEILTSREAILDRLGERDQQATTLTLMQTLAELMGDEARLAATHNRRAIYFDKISEYQAAAEAAQVGLRMARRSGKAQLQAQSLNLLALAAWRRFDYHEVKNWANQALEALKMAGDPITRITSLLHLGRASYRLGQYDAALNYVKAAQELTGFTDNRDSDALADLILGWIYQRLGQYELAEKHFQATLQKRRLIGDRYGEATALSHLGWLAHDQQNQPEGLRYCQEALDISQAIADRENEAYALSGMALNHEYLGNLDAATTMYQQALAIHRDIGATSLEIFDRAGLARLALAQENFEQAQEHIMGVVGWIATGNAQQFWDPWVIYQSAYRVLTALGETGTAATILDEAHTLLHQRAKEISDEALRHCFLDRVAVNRDLEETWHKLNDPA